MPNFKGFSTINKSKKFTLTDRDLIKRDLLNALLIRPGQIPGRPEVGSAIWDYMFDPNDTYMTDKIDQELRRIIALDTRIELHEIAITAGDNVIRAYVSISLLPDSDVEDFYINFQTNVQTATITST